MSASMAHPIQSRSAFLSPFAEHSSHQFAWLFISGLPFVFFFTALISLLISFVKFSNARDETFISIANKESSLHEGWPVVIFSKPRILAILSRYYQGQVVTFDLGFVLSTRALTGSEHLSNRVLSSSCPASWFFWWSATDVLSNSAF